MEIYIIVGLIIWFLIGLFSFYYWITKEEDILFDFATIFIWFAAGFLGIVSWFILRDVYKQNNPKTIKPQIIFKKRK